MVGTPPAPEELARRLLTQEAGTSLGAEELAAAAERIHARLRQSLGVYLGQSGFDSLWTRAMRLAQVTVPFGSSDGAAAPATGFQAVVRGRNTGEARTALIAMFASFIGLLYTFVGASLGLRLIGQVWPKLFAGDRGTHMGEVQP